MSLKMLHKVLFITMLIIVIIILEGSFLSFLFGNDVSIIFALIMVFVVIYVDMISAYFLNKKFDLFNKICEWVDEEE